MKILVDPGHGIDTKGKRSPDGLLLEYLWNRDVADMLVEACGILGLDAELLVTETNDIPLTTRVQRINKICSKMGAENVVLVSVHANAYGDGQWVDNVKGWSCYTSPGQTQSDRLAEMMYDAFEREFPERKIRRDLQDGDRDYEANFYILTKSKCPAVLLENFFYTSREECSFLTRYDTKIRIASAAALALSRFCDR